MEGIQRRNSDLPQESTCAPRSSLALSADHSATRQPMGAEGGNSRSFDGKIMGRSQENLFFEWENHGKTTEVLGI